MRWLTPTANIHHAWPCLGNVWAAHELVPIHVDGCIAQSQGALWVLCLHPLEGGGRACVIVWSEVWQTLDTRCAIEWECYFEWEDDTSSAEGEVDHLGGGLKPLPGFRIAAREDRRCIDSPRRCTISAACE